MSDRQELLRQIASYYREKISLHGATPRGVDWSTEEGQEQRFARLMALVSPGAYETVIEIGCGYGALAHFLDATLGRHLYQGYDISSEMVARARLYCADLPFATFAEGSEPTTPADYVVASGIFNVRLEFDDVQWTNHVRDTIRMMVRYARRGVSFNCLTAFSDPERMESRLWYPRPGVMLDWCLSEFGRRVTLVHDYDMYEFTMSIRTDS